MKSSASHDSQSSQHLTLQIHKTLFPWVPQAGKKLTEWWIAKTMAAAVGQQHAAGFAVGVRQHCARWKCLYDKSRTITANSMKVC